MVVIRLITCSSIVPNSCFPGTSWCPTPSRGSQSDLPKTYAIYVYIYICIYIYVYTHTHTCNNDSDTYMCI